MMMMMMVSIIIMMMSPVIAVHLTASLIALVTGPLVIFARLGSKKMPRIHRAFGYGWASMMILSATSALFIRDYGLPNIWGSQAGACVHSKHLF